ncbi:Peptidoglycan-associated lipoprotein [Nymphon striatum]|nr:Peptidoglycan-associated lipoprotein [Nymphon striatum]
MKTLTKVALLTTTIALAACAQSPFDRNGDGTGSDTNGLNNDGISSSTLDANSPAYFNQTVGNKVLFEVDQSTINDTARATLTQQANWLKTNTTYTAIVEGHADEQGTREYNLALGARRAAAARDYLVANGVADNRLRTVTFGKERPVGPLAAQDQSLADIRSELGQLNSAIVQLRSELSSGNTGGLTITGDTLQRIDIIEAELSKLTAKTESLENRINRVVTDGTNRVGDLEFRLCELEEGCDLGSVGQAPTLGGDVGAAPAAAAPISTPDTGGAEARHFRES